MRLYIYLFLLLHISTVSAQLHGTSANWTTPTPLPKVNAMFGNATKGGTGQNIIRLYSGELIQCYLEQFPGPPLIYLLKSKDDGASWLPAHHPQPTSKTPGSFGPTIAKDTANNIHLIWVNDANKRLYYCKLDKDFNVIIDTVRINQATPHNTITSPYISVDRKNRVHIMWHDGDVALASSSVYFSKVFYRQSPDGGNSWNTQQSLSDSTIHKHAAFPRANFTGVDGDTVAIPWRQEQNGTNWNVWMAYSTDGGLQWNRVLAGSTIDAEWDPGIVVDKNGRIHLHYHEYTSGNMTMSTMEYAHTDNLGNSWTPSSPNTLLLSPEGIRSQLSIFSYDYNTNVHCICWKDERDFVNVSNNTRADIMCSFSIDGGSTWQGQEFICDLDTISVLFKSVDVGSNNTIYVTYEYPDSNGKSTLYFTKRQIISGVTDFRSMGDEIHIYPNPASGILKVESKIPLTQIDLIDVSGRIMKSIPLLGVETESRMELMDVPDGVYYLKCNAEDKIFIHRIAKMGN